VKKNSNPKKYIEKYIVEVKNSIYNAHLYSLGRIILGEIKLTIILRLLAGASYLDLYIVYSISYKQSY